MQKTIKKVNVAPSSTHGHFVTGAENVIDLDIVNETFQVKGKSTLASANHTTLKQKEGGLITCQVVIDPFTGAFNKSKD